jgi:hypothetical protein
VRSVEPMKDIRRIIATRDSSRGTNEH